MAPSLGAVSGWINCFLRDLLYIMGVMGHLAWRIWEKMKALVSIEH